MSLLDQEVKEQETKGKKIVLILLILSIILLIVAIGAMYLISSNKQKALTLIINNSNIKIEENTFTQDENGINYISAQKIATPLGYNYKTGGYKEYSEDATNTKAYLEKEKQVVQIEAENTFIYKTVPDSYLNMEEYKLQHKILKVNDLLYISLDDLPVVLNVIYNYSEKDNQITLKTVEMLAEDYKNKITENPTAQAVKTSEEFDNYKAIAYNMIVVANSSDEWGVVDTDFSTVIGNKYDSMLFVEQANTFIVSDNGKFGVISCEPNKAPIIDLSYEQINVISYNPLCYEVKSKGKSLIANAEGKAVISDKFDSVGCLLSDSTEEAAITIDNLENINSTALVVCKGGKYGLIDLNKGNVIINCTLNKIYGKNENGEKKYYVQYGENEQQQERSLNQYINEMNTINVNIGD